MKKMLLLILPIYLLGVDYIKDIKPILDKRCVSCHSCYNSPCQLKLSSFEGLDRGATKRLVYDGSRLDAVEPTRLFIDAKHTFGWRQKDFFSVTESNKNDSLLLELLKQKTKNPGLKGEYKSEEDLTCAKDKDELDTFLDKHPNRGMPFGFPALKENEYKIIEQWVQEGAKNSPKKEKENPPSELKKFENFLNKDDAKHSMSARYIYEHIYLAHISFESKPLEFYELVRSYTPVPQKIDIIPTVLPYEDPFTPKFYYRFKKIESTIVHKTHMVLELSMKSLQNYQKLFIDKKWDAKAKNIGYKTSYNANPFKVFAQIPAASRYQFLLDNREFIIRNFIRGPVCKGQVALNVINDHFWFMFMKPEYDLSLARNGFLDSQLDNLEMPIKSGNNMEIIETVKSTYKDKAFAYYVNRQKFYDKTYSQGLDESSVSKNILTIYRHFDSATVLKGAYGNLPRTVLLVDYPLLERVYYALVAGFDVYGSVGHQLGARSYMNSLRIEGESNFINLLPLKKRDQIFHSWNQDSNMLRSWFINRVGENELYLSKVEAKKKYHTNDPKRELIESIVDDFDPINYFHKGEKVPSKGFRSLTQKGTPFIRYANGMNTNLSYIRVKNIPNEKDKVYSVIVNRWHDNVLFMFDEESRLDASKDDLDFIEGFVGSYPNLFIVVEYKDFDNFIAMMKQYDGSPKDIEKFKKYGIFRSDKDFWNHFDWFQSEFKRQNPLQAGLFDLNRYYSITP